MANKANLLRMLIIVLTFGMTLVSCDISSIDTPNKGGSLNERDSTVPVPTGFTGYIDSNGYVYMEWNEIPNATYQIAFISDSDGKPYQFSAPGASDGVVTINRYSGQYPYSEIRSFAVRAKVNGKWGDFSSPVQLYKKDDNSSNNGDSDNGDSVVPAPTGFTGYIDSYGYVYMEWDEIPNATYQIFYISGEQAYSFNTSGASDGIVTTNKYYGLYPYSEIRSFVVRAKVNDKWGEFSSLVQLYKKDDNSSNNGDSVNGDSVVPVPTGFTGYIDSNGYVYMEWNEIPNATYQICYISEGQKHPFSASGTSDGIVTTNKYSGLYPYSEIRSFAVRAKVNDKWGEFSSPVQLYKNIEVVKRNGKYCGTTWVLYDYALNGINTIVFGDDTVTFSGSLFTGKSRAAKLSYDPRNVVGEHTSMIGDRDYTGAFPVYYDLESNGTAIKLGRIVDDELYPLVDDIYSSYSTRKFTKIASLDSNNGDSSVPVPTGFTGYIDANGNVYMEWNEIPNATYQIAFISDGKSWQFSAPGASDGIVTTNSYYGQYPYFIVNNPEIRTFVVRAKVNGKWGKFSSPVQFYPNIEIINYDDYPNYTYTSTVWTDNSGGAISFDENSVTLSGSYWSTLGIETGTYSSFFVGTGGWLIQVITDTENNTGFQIVTLFNAVGEVYGITVQNTTLHIFSKSN